MRYSGSLMKYSFSEVNQSKGVQLVELDGQGNVDTKQIALSPKRDMRIAEGYFDELMAGEGSRDYTAVRLLDKVPILDAKGRLEKKYPYLLQLERSCYEVQDTNAVASARTKMSEAERFAVFFKAMTGEDMTDEQKSCLAETIDEVYQSEREVKP